MKVAFTNNGIKIGEQEMPLYSGSIHYWRLEKELWGTLLDSVKDMGFNFICTYIPWSVHELAPGIFDFSGNKDIDHFFSLCREKDIYILVRPGPHINAEMTYFGYPKRILLDPEIQAVTALDTLSIYCGTSKQFPIPSYASRKLYNEAGIYFDNLCPVLVKHQYPDGNIVAVQSDNETCYFFQFGAYDLDYHPDSIELYRNFLKNKYNNIENLNSIYYNSFYSFEEVDPPRGCCVKTVEKLPHFLDWGRYKEYQLKYSVQKIASMLKKRGLDNIPCYHNYPWSAVNPFDISGTEELPDIDIAGLDIYRNKEDFKLTRTAVKSLCGLSKLPFVPEFGAGVWIWHSKTFSVHDEEFTSLYAFMHGLKAVNYYMIVERERWQGSPVTRSNKKRPSRYNYFQNLLKILRKNEFYKFSKNANTIILRNYEFDRFSNIHQKYSNYSPSLPNDFFKCSDIVEFKNPKEVMEKWIDNIEKILIRYNINYDIGDTNLNIEKIMKYDVVLIPTYDFLSERITNILITLKTSNKTIVFGPVLPYLNEKMKYSDNFSNTFGNTPWSFEKIEDYIKTLSRKNPFSADTENIEITTFSFNERRILCIANTSGEPIETSISSKNMVKLTEWFTGREFEKEIKTDVFIPGFSVQMYEVTV